jgi:hypothetical protein
MRFSALYFILLAAALALVGCHRETSSAPGSEPQPSQTVTAQTVPGQATGNPAPPEQPAPPKKKTPSSVQDVAQLDINSEGGVRDGSYAMWVHVTNRGKPAKNLPVVAYNTANKPVAEARTNEDGDAMLKVQATAYRIAATQGRLHVEQSVTFHPGDQFELELQH